MEKPSRDLIDWDDVIDLTDPRFQNNDDSNGSCPVCSRNIPIEDLQDHVNECLNQSEHNADPFSIPVDVEFELQQKKKEEENYKLLMEMLEEERRSTKRKQEELASAQYECALCKKQFPTMENMLFLEACSHNFCRSCLYEDVMKKVDSGKCSSIKCVTCSKPLLPVDIQDILNKDFEKYEKASLLEVVNSDQNFVKCPNPACTNIMERIKVNNSPAEGKVETDPSGQPLSKEAVSHRNENRFRCRECQTEFCASCKTIPYHLGYTCEKFTQYQKAKHCRFCNTGLTAQKTAPPPKPPSVALTDVCNSQDCLQKRDISCDKTHDCNHFCMGIQNEVKCPPCIKDDCAEKNGQGQNSEDYCNICWVEELGSAPAIKLDCGHFFHFNCVKKKIEARWTGSRITFGFLECALCKEPMSHPALKGELRPIKRLHKEVSKKAVERLELMNLMKSAELTSPDSKWFNKPADYAMYRFSYFPCYKCKKPYFGGEKVCEAAVAEFNPKELICGGCSDFAIAENCKEHGKDYIEYKCRFCCNVSVWFCFGTTHFCDDCHKKAGTIVSVPKDKLPRCNCQIKHPPNGEEFLLGCSMCRITKFNCFK